MRSNMIRFACPACGVGYKAAEEFAGRKTKCRKCGGSLEVPVPELLPEVLPVEAPAPAPEPLPKPRRPKPALSEPPLAPRPLVTITDDGKVLVNAKDEAEVKQAIRELRAKRKEVSLAKKLSENPEIHHYFRQISVGFHVLG
jgi:hypothetical protein